MKLGKGIITNYPGSGIEADSIGRFERQESALEDIFLTALLLRKADAFLVDLF